MNLVDLESFVVIADLRSIVAAAAQLHVTQSAITRRLQNLERSLGCVLFDRETRPLELTAAGRETYEFARPVLDSVHNLRRAVADDGEPAGEFRFGMPRGIGDEALVQPITALRKHYPKLRVRAFVRHSDIILRRLHDLELDAAIVILPEGTRPPDSFAAEGLGTEDLFVVGPKARKSTKTLSLKDLAEDSWVLTPPGGSTRQLVESALLQRRLPLHVAVEAEGHELQFMLIAEGVGLGLATRRLLHLSSMRRHLTTLTVRDFKPRLTVWLLYRRNVGRFSPAISLLHDVVSAHFRQRP